MKNSFMNYINFDIPVRDPIWGTIMFPKEFSSILESPDFIKLSRILQLGPAYIVYPGASHTRRAHSIGVFEMAKRLLLAVLENSDIDLSECEIRSFLASALCHDLGHFPYAHSLKELPLLDHEELTGNIVLSSLKQAIIDAKADPELVSCIVDKKREYSGNQGALKLFRHMLSGVLDPDKLDYLNRDAWACGVPYGIQDVDFIIRHYGLSEFGIPGIDERGIMSVEGVLFSKYQMYKAVYWHKSVRAATAMIKKAVINALEQEKIIPEMLYGLDDQGFYSLMENQDCDPYSMIKNVFNGKVYSSCFETIFETFNPTHRSLCNLNERTKIENELSIASKCSNIVIDIPEDISFESDMPIIGSSSNFNNCTSVFRPETVSAFTSSLRIIRVFAPCNESKISDVANCAKELLVTKPVWIA